MCLPHPSPKQVCEYTENDFTNVDRQTEIILNVHQRGDKLLISYFVFLLRT